MATVVQSHAALALLFVIAVRTWNFPFVVFFMIRIWQLRLYNRLFPLQHASGPPRESNFLLQHWQALGPRLGATAVTSGCPKGLLPMAISPAAVVGLALRQQGGLQFS